MNQKKIKKQINKINSFFESITADEEVSKIEKDLLLSYVRKLYEAILADEKSTVATPKVVKETPKVQKVPDVEVPLEEVPVVAERKPFERAVSTPSTTPDIQPSPIVEVGEPTPEKVVSAPVKELITEAPQTEVITSTQVEVSEKMESIFEKSGGNEISDRLSSLPITDLSKAMGINEKMFTIKELFGGSQEKFKTVISHINNLGGYEEAKEYLINGVATELEWDSESNYKKADKFVKLVQRRFS